MIWCPCDSIYIVGNSKGFPASFMKNQALSVNYNEPVLIGVSVTLTGVSENIVIVEIAMVQLLGKVA